MYNETTPNPTMTDDALHVHFPFSNCSHRHSYPPSTSMPFAKRKGSASIPINRKSMRKTSSEHRMAQDEAEADYKDFVFFSRVVNGISQQNSLLQDGSYLKSANEILIDNIVRSRHEQNEGEKFIDDDLHHSSTIHYYRTQNTFQDLKIVTPTRMDRHVLLDNFLNEVPSMPLDSSSHSAHYQLHPAESVDDYDEDEGIFDLEL